MAWRGGRRLLVPEVVQTSAMDCGPATLAGLLGGFGISASYGRLREACQTGVDGTSIDTLEDVANALGLDAEQILVPADHLVLPEAGALPAIVVTRLPGDLTHFVVVWRRLGPFVQLMDPAVGRRWIRARRVVDDLYLHETALPAAAWRAWASSDEYIAPLRRRLRQLGVPAQDAERLLAAALADPGWEGPAALDGAVRVAASLAEAGVLRTGAAATAVVERLATTDAALVPDAARFARAAPPDSDGTEQVTVRAAVVVRAAGRAQSPPDPARLPAELAAALAEPLARPGRDLLRQLRADGSTRPVALAVAAAATGAAVVGEGILLRAVVDRAGALPAALVALAVVLLLTEVVVVGGALGLGRRLEAGLRAALDHRLPRLPDRYLQSRPTSDLAERAHRLHTLRQLPELGADVIRSGAEITATAVAIAVLDPPSALPAAVAAVAAVAVPLAMQPTLAERDLRQRTHAGAMARFTLDALLGLVALRAHRGQRLVRRQHNALLGEWADAGRSAYRVVVGAEGLQMLVGFALAAWIVLGVRGRASGGEFLLLAYWALSLPVLGQILGVAARQYPLQRNVALRFTEPLDAPDEDAEKDTIADDTPCEPTEPLPGTPAGGVAVRFESVRAVVAGHAVLDEIDLDIAPGEHVAIVGRSGAGKSTLVGVLLGWHRPVAGRVIVDGRALDEVTPADLRRQTAWVDPRVHIWNQPLEPNLRYGAPRATARPLDQVMAQTGLDRVATRLPAPDAPLGEGGGLLSGGEGQRVRLARALLRPGVRLVLLDEPLRGLDRRQRHELLHQVRQAWAGATLVCITHDVGETEGFPRVVVVQDGRIVQDGPPATLAAQAGSAYRALLAAERTVDEDIWGDPRWMRLHLEGGRLIDAAAVAEAGP